MTSSSHAAAPAGGIDLRWQRHRAFLIAISAVAGWLDALAFLSLGKVFISFMSGNLLFLGIAAGNGDGGLLARAGVVLACFLGGTTGGAWTTGSRLAPGWSGPLRRALLVEGTLLAAFAAVWIATGGPDGDTATRFVLLALGATAMGFQAAIALALHLPNVATVAMTATLAQLGALVGWREREGGGVVGRIPAVSLMIPLCLAYLVSAAVVAAVPDVPAMALGPFVLVGGAAAFESRGGGVRVPVPVRST
jgi:uncharacterized membrane protein YoaK (UPF0700 family)